MLTSNPFFPGTLHLVPEFWAVQHKGFKYVLGTERHTGSNTGVHVTWSNASISLCRISTYNYMIKSYLATQSL